MTEDNDTGPSTQPVPAQDLARCPNCGADERQFEAGFGFAGGGYGLYTYCTKCSTIIDKVQVDE